METPMTLQQIKNKKKELADNIRLLLEKFSEETEVKLLTINKIHSFYDVDEVKGKYIINIETENPF